MSRQALAKLLWVSALALAPVAIPAPSFPSVAASRCFPVLLSLVTVYTPQPGLIASPVQSSQTTGSSLSNTQRWYVSFLTQQRVIAVQVDELRSRLRENLMGTEEFLEKLDPLLQRADRLYTQWKRIGAQNAERLRAGDNRVAGPGRGSPVLAAEAAIPTPGCTDCDRRNDVAVGKCLNYLRLSIVNLFLGYTDSNGRQIDDAERQAGLSVVWRSKSLSFISALEPAPGRPES